MKKKIIKVLATIGLVVAIFLILKGGFDIIMSLLNQTQMDTEKAKKKWDEMSLMDHRNMFLLKPILKVDIGKKQSQKKVMMLEV